mmetsp:Transcript_55225/g.108026  ORF Transcript_55225/g.108026 Transcript_55225/m.108026 type:complete len:105 (-) Transcript_55225:165-479(-)
MSFYVLLCGTVRKSKQDETGRPGLFVSSLKARSFLESESPPSVAFPSSGLLAREGLLFLSSRAWSTAFSFLHRTTRCQILHLSRSWSSKKEQMTGAVLERKSVP